MAIRSPTRLLQVCLRTYSVFGYLLQYKRNLHSSFFFFPCRLFNVQPCKGVHVPGYPCTASLMRPRYSILNWYLAIPEAA